MQHIININIINNTINHTGLDWRAAVNLGSAENFAVLGASTVRSAGNMALNGDRGVSPGMAITGFGHGVANGTTSSSGAVAPQAAADAATDCPEASSEVSMQDLTVQNLGGFTLLPGVRDFRSSAQPTGALILNAQGNPDA